MKLPALCIYGLMLCLTSWGLGGSPAQNSVVREVNAAIDNFEAMIQDPRKVYVVKFYAKWCSPCDAYGKKFVAFAKEHTHAQVVYLQVNVDICPEVVAKYRVKSIPTTLIIKKGEVVARMIGGNVINDLYKNLKKCGIEF